MKLDPRLFAAIGLMASLAACAPPPPPEAGSAVLSQAEATALVNRLNEEWDAALMNEDVAAAVAQYTDDAIRMEPGLPVLVGKEAIRTWMQSQHDRFNFQGANVVDEVVVLGPDWILVRSHGEFTGVAKAGGESFQASEKWLGVLQRQPDGSWKYFRDCGSSDLPQPGK